ncbi:MAG: alpha/beta fold hydrolase [Sarcina sp.]
MEKINLSKTKFISYSRSGNPKGETIVFVHSFLCDKTMWNKQIEKLISQYDCICIDLYGHGDSSTLENIISLEALAKDLLIFLNKLGISKFHYVGLSIGGMLCPYINKFTNNVKSFVIMDSYSGSEPKEQNKIYISLIDKIEKNNCISLIEAKIIAPLFFSYNSSTNTHYFIEEFTKSLINIPASKIPTICNIGRAIFNRKNDLNLLSKISTKTTFIVGQFDTCRPPEESIEMSKLIIDSNVYIVENAGHLCNIENSQEVNLIFKKTFKLF